MDLRRRQSLLLGLDKLTDVRLQAVHEGVYLVRLWQFRQRHDDVVERRNIVLDGATLFKLAELITCNVGVVQRTVVL